MNLENFSHSFDTLVNSYAFSPMFGDEATGKTIAFDEYEKSVFLTKAQEEIVLSLYSGRNSYGGGFEGTEEIRRYLANLIVETRIYPIENSSGAPIGVDTTSTFFTLPEDLWFITYEAVDISGWKCGGTKAIEVVPVTQDEYHKVKKNPFRGANDRRALRLDLSDGVIEIVSRYEVLDYYLRYLKRINPIVLTDMPDGLTVNNVGVASECEVHETLHQQILERAVLLAVQSKGYNRLSTSNDNN